MEVTSSAGSGFATPGCCAVAIMERNETRIIANRPLNLTGMKISFFQQEVTNAESNATPLLGQYEKNFYVQIGKWRNLAGPM